MLKIKDSVDLKELEKFGFVCFNQEQQNYEKKLSKKYDNEEINIYGKEINISLDGWETRDLDTLYDLIKADMVEKVEE